MNEKKTHRFRPIHLDGSETLSLPLFGLLENVGRSISSDPSVTQKNSQDGE